jgi:hypothetical protein
VEIDEGSEKCGAERYSLRIATWVWKGRLTQKQRWIHTFSVPVVLLRRFIFVLPLLVIYRRHKLKSNPRGRTSSVPAVLHIGLGLECARKRKESINVHSRLASGVGYSELMASRIRLR